MKSLRSFVIPVALGAALLAPVAVFAQQAGQPPADGQNPAVYQGPMRHGGHRHHGFMGLLHGVNLSAQQKSQIKQIMQQYRQAHPRGSQTDAAARKQSRRQLRAQIMNVLTPEQRTQVDQNMKQMRARWEQRTSGQRPVSPQSSPAPAV